MGGERKERRDYLKSILGIVVGFVIGGAIPAENVTIGEVMADIVLVMNYGT